ncbi:hypothetical protein C9J03_13680 [Photobacterium gaetbulicola]|nr:hypothetical protein C9J03_13680 [Photobacterium gaetbulicola]
MVRAVTRPLFVFISIIYSVMAIASESIEAASEFGWRAYNVEKYNDVPINQIHSWNLHITDSSGNPTDCVPLQVRGGMPAHRHGLPTQPQWHQERDVGNYRIDGLKFQMPGLWQVVFSCKDDRERTHEFIFEFML